MIKSIIHSPPFAVLCIMARVAEDLSHKDLQKTAEFMVCKEVTSPVVLNLPAGIFTPVALALHEMNASDSPSVNVSDVI